MKLYTEEQVREAYNLGRTDWINDIEDYNLFSDITPIQLPSDEEIGQECNKLWLEKHVDCGMYNDGQIDGFELGAIWMKNQILNQNK